MRNKRNKGITLIALVVTIIVLLILAGISISMLYGNNGILQNATTAKTESEISQEKEIIALAYNASLAKKRGSMDLTQVTAQDLNPELTQQGASASGDNPIIVTFNSSNRQYKIETNGKITLLGDEEPPFDNNWLIAWAYNGSYWSNPYTRENGLLDSYFENIDSNYSISNTSDLDNANVLALLYENENNPSTYKLIIHGTGPLKTYFGTTGDQPWRGNFHQLNSNSLSNSWNFVTDFTDNITNLEINEGITEIDKYAFSCLNITYAYIAESVRIIRNQAFTSTPQLNQVEIGNNFEGVFLDPYDNYPYSPEWSGYSDAFMESNWLYVYGQAHPECETVEYPQSFVTIPINGVNWKFLWWHD